MVIDKVGQVQPDLGSRIPCPCAIPTLPHRLVATGPAPSCPNGRGKDFPLSFFHPYHLLWVEDELGRNYHPTCTKL